MIPGLRRCAALLLVLVTLPAAGCNVSFNRCLPLGSATIPGPNRLGVGVTIDAANADAEADIAFTHLEQAGVKWARVPMSWAQIQPTRETFDWRIPDALAQAARNHGIRLQVVLKDTAPWASVTPFASPAARASSPPANATDWFRFVLLVSTRYKDVVKDWEIWEGVDRYQQWSGRPEQYMQLLGLAHKAIKLTNPQARVIMGSLTLTGEHAVQFLDTCLADRTFPFATVADAVAYQAGNAAPGEIRERYYAIRRDLQAANIQRPIQVSAVGWSSDRAAQRSCEGYQGGETGQAQFVREIMPWLIDLGAERVFWQSLWDEPPGAKNAAMGLIDRQLQPKAALGALTGLIDPNRLSRPIEPTPSDGDAQPLPLAETT